MEINELRYEPKDYVVICLSTLYFRINIFLLTSYSEDGGSFSIMILGTNIEMFISLQLSSISCD